MSQTVLVADDSKTIRQIVEMALKASSWEVVGVDSAQGAMDAARQSPSVILLDYYMPDGSGYDVCRALKSDAGTSGIPVVMLGGTYKNFDEGMANDAGADVILMKPFDTDTLLGAIEDAQNAAVAAPAPTPTATPEPEPAMLDLDEESEEDGYGYGYGDSDVSEPEPEPVYEAPTPRPTPQPANEPLPTPQPAARERFPTPGANNTAAADDATPLPSASSQPRIPAEPSRPDIAAQPAAGAGAPGVSRAEIEAMIRDQVKETVRAELPDLLRNVMGEIFQKKVLPKLMEHAENRVRTVVSENLTSQIQNHVRVELERLLEE